MKPKTVGRVLTPEGAATHSPAPVDGLIAGTTILTGDGLLPVEFLNEGDRVISRIHGMIRLEQTRAMTVSIPLVRVDANALGASRPERPMVIPAAQRVLVRGARARPFSTANQAVVPVGCLVDDDGVHDLGKREVRLFQLSFSRPEVIYADGIEIAIAPTAARRAEAA